MSTSEQQRSGEFTYSVGECPLQGQSLATHTWTPSTPAASWRGVVVIFHGYGAHGAYPTVKFGAELLASHGFVCMSVDFLGHGGSPGLPGYIAAAEDLTSCGTEFFEHAQATHPQMRCFLMGTSMGGAIALNVSLRVGIQCSGDGAARPDVQDCTRGHAPSVAGAPAQGSLVPLSTLGRYPFSGG